MYGFALSQAPRHGVAFAAVDAAKHERALEQLRARLGEPQFTEEWQAGQALSLDEAVSSAVRTDLYEPMVCQFIGLRSSY